MRKAKIYIPSKTATQSGQNKSKKWVLEFMRDNNDYDHLMNWESSKDTQSQVKLYFDKKDSAINYAKKNNIDFDLIEKKKIKKIIKSYANNFIS